MIKVKYICRKCHHTEKYKKKELFWLGLKEALITTFILILFFLLLIQFYYCNTLDVERNSSESEFEKKITNLNATHTIIDGFDRNTALRTLYNSPCTKYVWNKKKYIVFSNKTATYFVSEFNKTTVGIETNNAIIVLEDTSQPIERIYCHEVGHHVYDYLTKSQIKYWKTLFKKAKRFPTTHSKKDEEEYFAELFACYHKTCIFDYITINKEEMEFIEELIEEINDK